MMGIFDSGFGGLTILRELLDVLPEYSYMYLGDNANAPYGSRSTEEITELTKKGIDFLFSQGCELIILGCNTASANALRTIQQSYLPERYPDKKVLGIVVPTIEQITGVPWKHVEPMRQALENEQATVGILATEATIQSGAYEIEITKRNPNIFVVQQACNGLVDAIEKGNAVEIETLVSKYVTELYESVPSYHPPLQAVLLGCTHFQLIFDVIQKHLKADTYIYGQPSIVAASLKEYLKRHPEFSGKLSKEGKIKLFTTARPEDIEPIAHMFLQEKVSFQLANIS